MSETAENSGEEAGEGALDVEAGEMTDGGEDDYDEDGSHHLVRAPAVRAVHPGRSPVGRRSSESWFSRIIHEQRSEAAGPPA